MHACCDLPSNSSSGQPVSRMAAALANIVMPSRSNPKMPAPAHSRIAFFMAVSICTAESAESAAGFRPLGKLRAILRPAGTEQLQAGTSVPGRVSTPRKKSKFSNADPTDRKHSDGRGPGCKGSQSHCTGGKAGPGLITGHVDLRIPAYRKQMSSNPRMYTPGLEIRTC